MKKSLFTLACLSASVLGTTTRSETTYEDGPNGARYAVTRTTTQRLVPVTEYQTREHKVYQPQVVTEYQTYQHTYLTPVTQYQYVPQLRNWWNPFTGAYWTHELRPITYWQARPATVQVPITRTNWVEGTQTTQVPVTTYKAYPEETYQKTLVSVSPATSAVAGATTPAPRAASAPIGGQQLQSDPPRAASNWTAPGSYRR